MNKIVQNQSIHKSIQHMVLRTSWISPFGRKVIATADILGLSDYITHEEADMANPEEPAHNSPLSWSPTLTLADGEVFFNGTLIMQYLNDIGGRKLMPTRGKAKWRVMRLLKLADGLTDAAGTKMNELVLRPEDMQMSSWIEYQEKKINHGLTAATEHKLFGRKGEVNLGTINMATLLEWLHFRQMYDWHSSHPHLIDWLETFNAAAPAFSKSSPPSDTKPTSRYSSMLNS